MLQIVHFTDPACPFAFSAEPVRQRLLWHYGGQIAWRHVMIVLTAGDRREADRLAGGAPDLQRRYGMPIDPGPRSRAASSEPACRAIVAARLFAPDAEEPLLRRLRVLGMAGGLLDDPDLLAQALSDVGLDAGEAAGWLVDERVTEALEADMRCARAPGEVAGRGLEHKLGGRAGHRRYSAPSYELSSGDRSFSLPGFNAVEAYEAAIANLAPELERRSRPGSARELLEWSDVPLATAEVALILQVDRPDAHVELARFARCIPAGAEAYWSIDPRPAAAVGQAPAELVRAVAATS